MKKASYNKKGQPYWTKERVIEAIQAWAKEHGRPPTTSDWRRATDDHPSYATLYQSVGGRFRTWSEAMEAAGFETARGVQPRLRTLSRRELKKRTREQRIADLRKALEDQ